MSRRPELVESAWKDLEIPSPRRIKLKSFSEAKKLWIVYILGFIVGLISAASFGIVLATPFFASIVGTQSSAIVQERFECAECQWYYRYNIRVVFNFDDGTKTGTIIVSKEIYDSLKVGSSVSIHYLSYVPFMPSLDQFPPNPFISLFCMVMALVMLGGLFYLIRKQKYLLINGKSVRGTIKKGITEEKIFGISFKKGRVIVNFENGGQEYRSNIRRGSKYYGGDISVGDEFVVLFDQNKPSKNTVYDPVFFLYKPVK